MKKQQPKRQAKGTENREAKIDELSQIDLDHVAGGSKQVLSCESQPLGE